MTRYIGVKRGSIPAWAGEPVDDASTKSSADPRKFRAHQTVLDIIPKMRAAKSQSWSISRSRMLVEEWGDPDAGPSPRGRGSPVAMTASSG